MANQKISARDVLTGSGLVSTPLVRAGSTTDYRRVDNLSASADPVVGDDSADGFHVGSIWMRSDNGHMWKCIDASAGAAVWIRMTAGNGVWQMPTWSISQHHITSCNTSSSNIAAVADRLYQSFFTVPYRRTFTQLAMGVSATGGTVARLGIYNVNSVGQPTTLILDAGTVDTSAGTGNKTIAISQVLDPGLYSFAYLGDGTPTIAMWADTFHGPMFFNGGTFSAVRGIYRSLTYTTLPSDESAQSYTNNGSGHPAIGIR